MGDPSQSPMPNRRSLIIEAEAGVLTGDDNAMDQPWIYPSITMQEESSHTPLLLSLPSSPSSLVYTPVTLEQPLNVSFVGEPQGTPVLPIICSGLVLQPCATPGTLLLQPQVLGKATNDSDQDSMSAALEWQQKMQAAEALLALKNSSQVPPEPNSAHESLSAPGPAGDTELEPSSPRLQSNSPNSVSLPNGQQGYILFFN
ncbi:doublesex- and mab-3-related transcription factor C1-like isoform X1 [Dipodomys merriami]|uniref:doublesex- and mab-3-related transcription factor C1-like isoform X1 n=1 Tax=Dipodomys merriami TaxID=94247 RepID=UPI003855D196